MHKNGVQSIERTFSIINELSQVPNGISLSKLATATALNKSTVHRLLSALIMFSLLIQNLEALKI